MERALALLCYIFPRLESALALLCYISRVWNSLGRYCAIFSACVTCYGVIVLYYPCVERALALFCYNFPRVERSLEILCYIFRVWNALWTYCVIFSSRGTRSGVIVLYFLCVERALVFYVKFISCCNILPL